MRGLRTKEALEPMIEPSSRLLPHNLRLGRTFTLKVEEAISKFGAFRAMRQVFIYGAPLRLTSLSFDYRTERLGIRAGTIRRIGLSPQEGRQLFQEVVLVPSDHFC